MQSAGCAVCAIDAPESRTFVVSNFSWQLRAIRMKMHVFLSENSCTLTRDPAIQSLSTLRPHSIHVHIPSMSTLHPCSHSVNVRAPSMSTHRPCPHVRAPPTQTHLDSQCVCTCIWIRIPIHLWLPARLTLPWPPLYFDAVLTACAPVVSHDAFNCFAHTTVNYLSGTMFGVDIFIWFDVWGWHFSIKAFFTTRCNVKIEIIMIR